MGTINQGNQHITFDYKQSARSRGFNQLNYKLHSNGIYEGGAITRISDTSVSVAPFLAVFEDPSKQTTTRIETTEAIVVAVNNTNIYIKASFSWIDTETNYMDVVASNTDETDTQTFILGRCIYATTVLSSNFDYSVKTWSSKYYEQQLETTNRAPFKVTANVGSNTNKVTVQPGVIRTNFGAFQITTPILSPAFSFGATKTYLVCVNKGIQNAVTLHDRNNYLPSYLLPIAQVSYTSGATIITGNMIMYLHPNMFIPSINENQTNFSFKNKLINGNFDFWQRATVSAPTSKIIPDDTVTFFADRWFSSTRYDSSGVTETISQQATDSNVPFNPTFGIKSSLSGSVDTAASEQYYRTLNQRIEDVRKTGDKCFCLSFYAKTTTGNTSLGFRFTQNFGSGGSGDVAIWCYDLGILSTVWTKYEVYVNLPTTTGKTIGTNSFLEVSFILGIGDVYATSIDPFGEDGKDKQIAQVQFEEIPFYKGVLANGTSTIGSIPAYLSSTFEQRPYSEELRLCQRYYEKSYNPEIPLETVSDEGIQYTTGTTEAGNDLVSTITFKETKAKTPTMKAYGYNPGIVDYWNCDYTGSGGALNIFVTFAMGKSTGYCYCDFGLAWTAARMCGHWTADAEL